VFKLGRDVVARAIDDDDARVRGEAGQIATAAGESAKLRMATAARERLDDPSPAIRARAVHVLHLMRAPLDADRIVALIADADATVRDTAIGYVGRISDDERVRLAEPLVAALRVCVQSSPGTNAGRSAMWHMAQLGERARPAMVDVANALAAGNHVAQARATMESIGGPLADDVRAVLADACRGDRSDAAAAATHILTTLAGIEALPEVAISFQLDRIRAEIASPDRFRRQIGYTAARALPPAVAAPLIPTILEHGHRIAGDTTQRSELSQIRQVLTALGVPADQHPQAPK
jgi:hypothetical protein